MKRFAVVWFLFSLCACGGGGSGTAPVTTTPFASPGYQKPNASICDANLDVTGGLLCAIAPSRLDVNSRDIFGNSSAGDMNLGFGFHAIAFPETGTSINGIYVHFVGSYGRPYDSVTDRFGSSIVLEESLAAGYLAIQVAYDNRYSVSLDECSSNAGINVDNCAGDVRMEKILGMDVSSVADTPLEDSIEYRLRKIAEFLDSNGVVLPFEIVSAGSVNWGRLHLGGHSQGGSHALYIAKYIDAQSVCLLAGGYDVPDVVPGLPPELLADWLLDDTVAVDIDRVRGLVASDDPFRAGFMRAFDHLGMMEGVHFELFSGAPYFDQSGALIDGHSAVVRDARFATERAQACF